MNRKSLTTSIIAALLAAQTSQTPQPAHAANILIAAGGRVSIELLTSESAWSNTLSVVSPNLRIALSGCKLQPALGLSGVHLLSEKFSQRGCRAELDADPATQAIDGFAANTSFEFGFCAQTDADPECEFVWSSDPAKNSDGFNHLRITPIQDATYPGQIFQLAWEDWPNGAGDNDFNDLVAIVRVQADSDDDGLWDDWERFGIDTTGDGRPDLILPNANPLRRNVYVEVDYMTCALPGSDCTADETWTHEPKTAALQKVIDAFANAPNTNPDGSTGITLNIEVSNAIPLQKSLGVMDCEGGQWGDFDAIKANPANFGPANSRRFAYHYALFAHRQQPGGTASGCAEIPGNDLMVTLGGWNTIGTTDDLDGDGSSDREVGTLNQQAGTLLHELGHNLGLHHGGNDDVDQKPNYLSAMNAFFQFGIPLDDRLDFSRIKLPTLNEMNLDETRGIDPNNTLDVRDRTKFFCKRLPPNPKVPGVDNGFGFIDWDCDGNIGTSVSDIDLNDDGFIGLLAGYDDWANLKFDFHNTADFDDGIHSPIPTHTEMDYPAFIELPGVVDLAVQQTVTPSTPTTFAGQLAQFGFDVTNTGPVPAANLTLLYTLPPGLTFEALTPNANCTQVNRVFTCTIAALSTYQHHTLTLSARIDPTLPDGTLLHNTVTISQTLNEANTANNVITTTLMVRRQSNLALTQTLPTGPVLAGRNLAYEVTIRNNGQSIATGVVLTNTLPVGVAFDGAASSPNCSEAHGLVTCALGTVLDEDSRRMTIAGVASAALRGGTPLTNIATVHADGLDPNPADNVSIHTTLLRSQTHLPLLFNQPTLATPSPTDQPDLIIKAITITEQAVLVVIQNIGPGAVSSADEFWVDLYISPTVAPQAVNQTWQRLGGAGGLVWGISGSALPLSPQQTLTLSLNDVRFAAAESRVPALIPAGAKIYAQVDSANAQTHTGGVLETHEVSGDSYNNISALTLAQPVSTAQWLQRPAHAAPENRLRIVRP